LRRDWPLSTQPRHGGEGFQMGLWAIDGTTCTRVDISNVHAFALRYRGPKSYWCGPGTSAQSLGVGGSGAIFGTGAKRIVAGVVAQILAFRQRYADAKIDLVGFSRGAAIANEVAAVLNELPDQEPVPVRFLGLFDPVHSMGFPLVGQGGMPLFLGNRRWHAKSIAANVERSAIAYADDERDALFLPSYLAPPVQDRQRHARDRFDGVHGDVGGTRGRNRHLGKIALRWMVQRAAAAGVDISTAGLVDDAWIEKAAARGWLTPSSGGQAEGERGWARTL
jgi:pimeloyl-ACP methyl ester carboxylesterase